MNRFTKKIKYKTNQPIEVIILGAGVGARIKSYEPRSLIKINNKSIVENQIDLVNDNLSKATITVVGGYSINKIIKKLYGKVKFIENQLYETTNSAESLRLAVNLYDMKSILFMHGDLWITNEIFQYMNFNESFVLTSNLIADKEVGLTSVNNVASIFSYNLPLKWAQIAFLRDAELEILKKLFLKDDDYKYNLTFEILNKIIENGGNFKVIDIGNTYIKEIDNIKDITNENTV